MKNKILILTLAAALGAGGLFVLKSHAETGGTRRAPGALLQRAKERLGITEAQAAQIRAVLKDDRETLAKLAREIHSAHIAMREVIQKNSATDAELRAAGAKLGAVQGEMAVERHKLFGKLKPILTPEQLERLADMQDKMAGFVDGAITTFEQRLAE